LSLDLFKKSSVEVAPGIFSFGSFSARSLFIVTNAGVIVTDPVSSENASDMRQAISKVSNLPVKFVIYSHQHWDHVLGGKIFKDEGATFISHENCIKHFLRNPNKELIMPDKTISNDQEIKLGDKILQLKYLGPNHGDCMLIMQVKGTDILYLNDLVTPYSVGLGFMPDYDPIEWIRTLKELEDKSDWSSFIGGHGIAIAPREALSQRRRFLESLTLAVKKAIDSGYRLEELYDKIELDKEFHEMRGYNLQIRRASERIYHYFTMGW